jgi:hypothetical protein
METNLLEEESKIKKKQDIRKYQASWVDRFTDWTERLPGPVWAYYLGIGLLLFVIQVIIVWVEGAFPFGKIDIAQLFLAAAIPYMLVLIRFFDLRANIALTKMQSVLKTSDEELTALEYRITTLPGIPTILASLVGISCIFLLEAISGEPYRLEALDVFPFSSIIFRILYFILWGVFGIFVYHTFHQLNLIGKIYTQYTRINLFRMKTLFAFSNLTALSALGLAVLPIGFLISNPLATWSEPVVFVTVLSIQIISLGIFIWPQWGIHRLQVEEKDRLLEDANQRFEAMIGILHQKVDEGKLDGAMDMNMTVSSLQAEIKAIESIPTWPWKPETLRLLVTALAFPLGVWLIQLILERFFGS